MLRNEWTFDFTAKKLAEAAAKKQTFHEGRLKFWTEAKAKVMTEVKDTGIEVSESEAGSNYTKGGFAPQVLVRNDLQKRLTECHGKISQHHDLVRQYAGWVQVFEANPEVRLGLHADDYLFFFGE